MSGIVWRVRLAARAERDLVDILTWSRDRFGAAQAALYRQTIINAIRELQDDPERAGVRNRNGILPGLRALHISRHGHRGRHFIMFRLSRPDNVIEILRLLHDAMDIPCHIPSLRRKQ